MVLKKSLQVKTCNRQISMGSEKTSEKGTLKLHFGIDNFTFYGSQNASSILYMNPLHYNLIVCIEMKMQFL